MTTFPLRKRLFVLAIALAAGLVLAVRALAPSGGAVSGIRPALNRTSLAAGGSSATQGATDAGTPADHAGKARTEAAAAAATFSTPLELTGHPPSPAFFQQDAEPEIKVDLFGNIYVTAIQGVPGGTDLWKSTNKGASFVYMGQPDGAQDHCNPPVVQCVAAGGGDDSIDVSSGGYLYVSSLWLGDVTMSTSMDGGTGGALPGQAWTVNPAAASVPVDDRQWIAAYGPQTVYLSYTDIGTGTIDVQKSTDAGKTFGPPVQVYDLTSSVFSDLQGNLVVDQYNGNLYGSFIPFGAHNQIYLFRSTDGGASFTLKQAYNGPGGTDNGQVFPSLAVDRGGNIHIAFSRCNTAGHTSCQIYMVSSTDQGDTWTPARQVSSGAATATAVLPAIAAGSPGIVDIAWLGSAASTPDVPSSWHVFFAQTLDALSATPTFTLVQAESAVMHDKSICFEGFGCPGDPGDDLGNRDLLEYFSMTIDPDGMANIAYPDSVNNCPASTCITNTWFIKQTGGTSAYAPPAPPAPATFLPNVNAGGAGRNEPNSWVDSHNCIFGGAINGLGGNSAAFRSQDKGQTFTATPVLVGSGLRGGDFDIITVKKADGSRPDQIYTVDLGGTSVHVGKSTDGGNTYFSPGTGGAAGEVSPSSDRMWLAAERGIPTAPDQIIYLMDHELASEDIRFTCSINDMPWSAFTSGATDPELFVPPSSTLPNTNPGPSFINPITHQILGVFGASSVTTNVGDPPFGKEANVWEAVGAPPAVAGLPPGPFVNHPVFKGVIDSPLTAPAGATTYGSHIAAIFPSAAADSAGNIYVVWSLNSGRPNATQGSGAPTHTYDIWFAASHDGGQNFYGPFRVSSGLGTSVFPWIAAGDDGRVDIVWYQSSNVAPPILADQTSPGTLTGGPNQMPAGSTWHVMFAQSLNADTREPVFTVTQASDHIVHTGSISIGGLTGNSDRSLGDFFEVSIGPDGKANIFNSDNGVSALHVNFARQATGPLALVSPNSITGCLADNTPIPTPTTPVPTATPTAAPPPTATPTPPPTVDLQVTNVFATNARPKEGDRVTLTATIGNAGTGNAGSSKTEFLLDDASVLGQIDTPIIPAGGSVNVSIAWDTRGLNGTHTIRVTADKTSMITETNEGNNVGIFTATVQGNKVKNGSFEQANSPGNAPEGWSGSSTGAGDATWSDGGSDGNKSVSASGNGGNAAASGSPSWTSDPIAVTAGEVLTLRVSVQSVSASSAATAGLAYLGAAGNLLSTVNLITAPLTTTGFTKLEQAVTIPAGVAQVRVQLVGFAPTDLRTSGTVRFDEVGLYGN